MIDCTSTSASWLRDRVLLSEDMTKRSEMVGEWRRFVGVVLGEKLCTEHRSSIGTEGHTDECQIAVCLRMALRHPARTQKPVEPHMKPPIRVRQRTEGKWRQAELR